VREGTSNLNISARRAKKAGHHGEILKKSRSPSFREDFNDEYAKIIFT
jgi:hypothetical protein